MLSVHCVQVIRNCNVGRLGNKTMVMVIYLAITIFEHFVYF